MVEMQNYFSELREQIMNKEKWDKNRFHVFDYEAGSGKSQMTFRYIAELANKESCRILYVQSFVKDDKLVETVETINKHAKREIAIGFDGDDTGSNIKKRNAEKAQVLCVSHRMYLGICQGNHPYLINDRQILVIDEYPELLEKVSIFEGDIGLLWEINYKYKSDVLEELAITFRQKKADLINKFTGRKKNQMIFLHFRENEYERLRLGLQRIKQDISDKKDIELIEKFLQILTNACFFYEKSFHTFNNKNVFKLLDCNIILDANAGFDHRYQLSKKFLIRPQKKFFDYSHSHFIHYEIGTSKTDLAKQINLPERVFELLSLEQKEKTLIISDKKNEKIISKKLSDHLSAQGFRNEEIDKMLNERIRIDHFGNLIGVNTYRDFSNVVVMKTPNYDYLSYALTYFYFSSMEGIEIENIEVFKHELIEQIRKSCVAGEIYQAIKRVNRDNSRNSEIYVFSTSQDAINIVLGQLPGINYRRVEMEGVHKQKEPKNRNKKPNKIDIQAEELKRLLLEAISDGRSSIRKNELREKIGENDKGNFSRVLNRIQPFLIENNFDFKSNIQVIYLK